MVSPNIEYIEKLIQAVSDDYVEKLYYFCLKKTGNTTEAEDLASDITLNIITALRKGTIPTSFSAWIWKIARNRYSVWSNKKHKQLESLSGADISALDITDEKTSEADYLVSEEIKLLRRELAFISQDYRNILVAFYIDDRKVDVIAKSLRLPPGTVKSKLFYSRKILKEGMNMAREFGERSYKPESIRFMSSGSPASGYPWRAVDRKIPKNILLQANNNPSTIAELSIELGIAAPYMEEEVKLLTDATLLREVGGKYISNFFIADKECQLCVYNAQRRDSKQRSRMFDALIDSSMGEIKKLGIMRSGMRDIDFKWLLLTRAIDNIKNSCAVLQNAVTFKRPNGGTWGFMGYEIHELIPEAITTDHSGCGSNQIAMFWAYSYYAYNQMIRAMMSDMHVILLADLIKNDRVVSSLSDSEFPYWKDIENKFAHSDESGHVIPDIAVFEPGVTEKMFDILKKHPLYSQAEKMVYELFNEIQTILKQYSNPILHEQLNYYVSMFMSDIRMMLINDEVEAGKLIIPEFPDKSTICMYLEIV